MQREIARPVQSNLAIAAGVAERWSRNGFNHRELRAGAGAAACAAVAGHHHSVNPIIGQLKIALGVAALRRAGDVAARELPLISKRSFTSGCDAESDAAIRALGLVDRHGWEMKFVGGFTDRKNQIANGDRLGDIERGAALLSSR